MFIQCIYKKKKDYTIQSKNSRSTLFLNNQRLIHNVFDWNNKITWINNIKFIFSTWLNIEKLKNINVQTTLSNQRFNVATSKFIEIHLTKIEISSNFLIVAIEKLLQLLKNHEKSKNELIFKNDFLFIFINIFSSANFSSQRFNKTYFISIFTSRESHNLNYVHVWIVRVNKYEIIRFDLFFLFNFQFDFDSLFFAIDSILKIMIECLRIHNLLLIDETKIVVIDNDHKLNLMTQFIMNNWCKVLICEFSLKIKMKIREKNDEFVTNIDHTRFIYVSLLTS